jgi:toxin YoeB
MSGVARLVSAWRIVFTPHAAKDAKKLRRSGLKPKAEALIEILRADPFQSPPPFEKLVGDLAGAFSRRINIHHRLVYQVLRRERIVKVIRMWTHYE